MKLIVFLIHLPCVLTTIRMVQFNGYGSGTACPYNNLTDYETCFSTCANDPSCVVSQFEKNYGCSNCPTWRKTEIGIGTQWHSVIGVKMDVTNSDCPASINDITSTPLIIVETMSNGTLSQISFGVIANSSTAWYLNYTYV